ncbi:MaoC/PaaZ C-terminal domain-containing protein [Anianabacter salinae]|uniref:MaoC/PaaZ C-terminal domain-containing protein n=1 Tax=Anianabacter salinae TaxID=2851023 RepID=UPI00225E5BB1|nr:MaoC/PaaZ C-terminal domain-containing protein [Anianabacter salinae]MBV0913791.1 hydratase [Anianabacter salinae]
MTELRQTWLPTQDDFDRFADVSGDDNPIHVDPDFSARTAFGGTVSHGMLIYTKLWGMIRAAYPEAAARRQTMMFPNPAFTGEEVRLEVDGALPGAVTMRAIRIADEAELFLGEAEVA